MKIIVDCMSGDYAPDEIVKGAIGGADGCSLLLVGNEQVIRKCMAEHSLSGENIEIADTAADSVTMEDDPLCIMKEKKDSSMGLALRLLAQNEGDALVSAGNTGALFTGSTLTVKRAHGIRRAALAAIIPLAVPVLLVDSGANTDVTPEILLDFARMGELYAKNVMKLSSPRIGLINNGTEETKGTELYRNTYAVLKQSKMNFVGNVEAREVPNGICDVLVADGFTGNVILKLCEGFGSYLKRTLKTTFYKNTRTKTAAVMMSGELAALKKKMDYSEYGGAPLLGIRKPVIKAHGSSKSGSISACIRQAASYAGSGIIEKFALLAEK